MRNQISTQQDQMTSTDPLGELSDFLIRKQQEGFLSKAELDEIMWPIARITGAAGVSDDPNDSAEKAIDKQAMFLVEKKLKVIKPDLLAEFKNKSGREL